MVGRAAPGLPGWTEATPYCVPDGTTSLVLTLPVMAVLTKVLLKSAGVCTQRVYAKEVKPRVTVLLVLSLFPDVITILVTGPAMLIVALLLFTSVPPAVLVPIRELPDTVMPASRLIKLAAVSVMGVAPLKAVTII